MIYISPELRAKLSVAAILIIYALIPDKEED